VEIRGKQMLNGDDDDDELTTFYLVTIIGLFKDYCDFLHYFSEFKRIVVALSGVCCT